MRQGRRAVAAMISALGVLYAAPSTALDWSPFVSVAFTSGGSSLGKTVVKTQTGTSTHHIRAGQFMLLSTGVTVAMPGLDAWEGQVSAGYWFDSVQGNGGEMRFRRVPFDIVAVKNINDAWRVSGGVTYHTGIERRCTQDDCTVPSTTFDNAFGIVVETDWLVGGPVTRGVVEGQPGSTKLWFGARVTLINYHAPQPGGGSYRGNNAGLVLGLNF